MAILNPRFLSPINLANTANLIGLFGLFSLGEGFVIITGGIELSVGSIFALLGVIFVDLLVDLWRCPWRLAVIVIVLGGIVLGAVHGLLITRLKLQPFIVTLCGLLIYRGIARFYTDDGTAGFAFGQSFPDARMADHRPHLRRAALLHRASSSSPSSCGWCCTARCSAAISSPSARTRRRRAIPASAPTASSSRPMSSAAC